MDVMMKFFFNDNGEHIVLGDDTDEFGRRTMAIMQNRVFTPFLKMDNEK